MHHSFLTRKLIFCRRLRGQSNPLKTPIIGNLASLESDKSDLKSQLCFPVTWDCCLTSISLSFLINKMEFNYFIKLQRLMR